MVSSTVGGAHVVGVHWRGRTDYPLTGDGAHAVIDQKAKLALIVHHVEDDVCPRCVGARSRERGAILDVAIRGLGVIIPANNEERLLRAAARCR